MFFCLPAILEITFLVGTVTLTTFLYHYHCVASVLAFLSSDPNTASGAHKQNLMDKSDSFGTEHFHEFSLIICVVLSGELHPAGRAVRKVQI